MTDIVERLRDDSPACIDDLLTEAADEIEWWRGQYNKTHDSLGAQIDTLQAEIERLRAENARLRAALRDAAMTLEANGFVSGQAWDALGGRP